MPDQTRSKKIDRYAENRGYEEYSVKKASRNYNLERVGSINQIKRKKDLSSINKPLQTPTFVPRLES